MIIRIKEVVEKEKYYDYIKPADFIMLNFDLMNRDSYEDINNRWKDYLMNEMEYSNKVYLLGNYKKKGFPLTDRQEIDEIINDGIKIDYFEIGGFSDEELVKFFDDKVFKALQERIKNKPTKGPETGSCIIY